LDANPSEFKTLCRECHERAHPGWLTEYLRAGWTVQPRREFAMLGIALPIIRKEQLVRYKEFMSLAKEFADLFQRHGLPEKTRLPEDLLRIPRTRLPDRFRAEAARKAINLLRWVHMPEWKKKRLKKLTDEERGAVWKQRTDEWLQSRLRARVTVCRMGETCLVPV
jgi:hypothetical protein